MTDVPGADRRERTIEAVLAMTPEDAAGLVREALRDAADPARDDPARFEADRAAVAAARQHRSTDDVLERIDPDDLAGVVERTAARLAAAGEPAPIALRREGWEVLDLVRRRAVLRRIDRADVPAWSDRLLDLVARADFTTGPMFRHRVETYGSKTLFEIATATGHRPLSWRQTALRVETFARGLLSLADEPGPVAILSENRIEMALVDLACLTSGIVDVMIPASSTEADVGYMLRHARCRTAVVSTPEQLRKVQAAREACPELSDVVVMTPPTEVPRGVRTLEAVAAGASAVPQDRPRERGEAARIDDLATVMYTSGTTGMPKGIQFSHRNIVFKRFARALALPEIGDRDVFLCYLPLFHTFGRYLEMVGSIFWGATYCFQTNPSVEAMIRDMRRHLPTVFISVPKKWLQLYEAIEQRVDPLTAPDEEIEVAVREVTGGRLRWGLSAAGHLPAEVFRFFQRHGVELLSGFGMTEATGGITMTPPGEYRDDSLGVPLPGIEARIAGDGELLVRGPYVMTGYLDPPDGAPSFDADGWFATGDLMERDRDGHIKLVDRKKEIYKNIKGETIAPQRVENLFRDFDSVGMVFLVGDHREYNTALIYPNPNCKTPDLSALSPSECKAHFRSLVVSVNQFLAPFERIVDFAVVDRALDPERGELTPKGTPRRRNVERNFRDVIDRLYRRSHLHVGGVDVVLPNWLFQALGLTSQSLHADGAGIHLPSAGRALRVGRIHDELSQIGSCLYHHRKGGLNLGSLLTAPRLWLGNDELVEWAGIDLAARQRPGRSLENFSWQGRAGAYVPTDDDRVAIEDAMVRERSAMLDVHLAALLLASGDGRLAGRAVDLLERILREEEGPLMEPARIVLARAAESDAIDVRRRAFQVLAVAERESRFAATVRRFLDRPGVVLDESTRAALREVTIEDAKITALIETARELCRLESLTPQREESTVSLLDFLADYGAAHPAIYHRIRWFLTRAMLFSARESLRAEARRAWNDLLRGFRAWLGPSSAIAVDPETGLEYRWRDVVAFDDDVPIEDRRRLLEAIRTTPVLREGVFLFARAASIRLSDIPPGGVSVRLLGINHGKSVYRATIQTRFQGSFDLAINVNRELADDAVEQEIHWLILCGGAGDRPPLVEEFGGYWPAQDLWTEEFIPGETLERALRRMARREAGEDRFRQIWPFLAWTTLSAYVDFWFRTGRRWEIADPSPANVVVPTDDYQTGARLVSVTLRRPHEGLIAMVRRFRDDCVAGVEREYPALEGIVGPEVPFSAILEIMGERAGVAALRRALDGQDGGDDGLVPALAEYLDDVEVRGFVPLRVHFAIERYHRWAALTVDATPQARARTLHELYETYGLRHLARIYPESRVRVFRETVLAEAPAELVEGLDDIVAQLRHADLAPDAVVDAIADLRGRLQLGADEDFFLARLSYPHLRPEDSASFVDTDFGGRHQSEVMVALEDRDGRLFRVRHALNPREVGRLHRLYIDANLDVRFRMEHQYLVAVNDRGSVIGGIFYEIEEGGENAHLEKIVVAEPFRKKGVADGLMKEFFNRLRAAGVATVTTGFFRPEYFYGYGFKIEKRYAGLVKEL